MKTAWLARLAIVLVPAVLAGACADDGPQPETVATTSRAVASTTSRAVASTTSGPATGAPTTAPPTTAPPTTSAPSTSRPAGAATTTAARPATSAVTTAAAAPLFGNAIGAPAEASLASLRAVLGPPATDDGWQVGCPLDDPVLKNERTVVWGRLRVVFRRDDESTPGTLTSYGLVVPEGTTLAATDAAARLALPNGVTLGMPIATVGQRVGAPATPVAMFGWLEVVTTGAVFTADGDSPQAPLNAVWVPYPAACE